MSLEAQLMEPREEPAKPVFGRRYKAEIGSVSPTTSRDTFEDHDTCFLGVSLENSNFKPAKVDAMAKWISRRFSQCTVLIGDSIHRITLESTRSMPPRAALDDALRLGREFVESRQPVFESYRDRTKFTFVTCSEVQSWGLYGDYHERLRQHYDQDAAFRGSVEAFGRDYHGKRSEGVSAQELDHRIRKSSEYFLEEFAIFACLQRTGSPVMVYPGSFSTLSEIAQGKHPGAPEELRDLIVVSLHLKGR